MTKPNRPYLLVNFHILSRIINRISLMAKGGKMSTHLLLVQLFFIQNNNYCSYSVIRSILITLCRCNLDNTM
jgi:predicted ATPase